ncbi:MAG: hypothetical protein AB1656_02655 [Candidatus Omnitrophota bacterium]
MKLPPFLNASPEPIANNIENISRSSFFFGAAVSLLLTLSSFYFHPLSGNNTVTIYVQMAKSPYQYYAMPHGSRLLTPLIVHFLPFAYDTGFRAVAFVSFFASGLLIFSLLKLFKLSDGIAAAFLPAFFFAPAARFIIAHAWFPDPMTYLCLSLFFFGAITANLGITTAGVTLGALNRPESLAIVPVLAAAWWVRKQPLRSLAPVVLSSIPGILIYGFFWDLWPKIHSDFFAIMNTPPESLSLTGEDLKGIFQQHGFSILLSSQIYREMLPCLWGPAAVGIISAPKRLTCVCLTHVFFSTLPMLVAVDFFRLPFLAFPAVFLLAAAGFAELRKINRWLPMLAIAAVWLHLALVPLAIWPGIVSAILFVILIYKWRTLSLSAAENRGKYRGIINRIPIIL